MAKEETVAIKPIKTKTTTITIVGDTPLVIHCWDEKAKKMILDKEMGIKTTMKEKPKKSPVEDYINSLYWLSEKPIFGKDMSEEDKQAVADEAVKTGIFGFPITGIKQAANSSAYRLGWVKNMMALRGSYFLKSKYGDFVQIEGVPHIREDMVKVGMGAADIRYRAQFDEWSATFDLIYNENGSFSLEDICNCINAGGYVCGIGEWRPERDGQFGMYHIKTK